VDEPIIRNLIEGDVEALAACMRWQDELETRSATGMERRDVLRQSVAASSDVYAVEVDGAVVAIFGVAPCALLSATASPWLLAGKGFPGAHAKTLLRESQYFVAQWLERFPILENYVDARNTPSLRYLKSLGAVFDPPAPYGPYGTHFIRFEFRR